MNQINQLIQGLCDDLKMEILKHVVSPCCRKMLEAVVVERASALPVRIVANEAFEDDPELVPEEDLWKMYRTLNLQTMVNHFEWYETPETLDVEPVFAEVGSIKDAALRKKLQENRAEHTCYAGVVYKITYTPRNFIECKAICELAARKVTAELKKRMTTN